MNRLASIIIVTYNSKEYLESCINSVKKQNYPFEIIIVDNNSQDGSVQFIKKNFPDIKLIENKKNLGFSVGNNLGAKKATGEYVVFLNPDTIVENNWLKELIDPLENDKNIVTTSKILLYDGSAINTCGNINHFTGLTFTRGLNEKPDKYNKNGFVSGISGCSFAIRKKDFEEIDGFDENFFLYNEDSDFSWKLHLKKFKILYVSSSIVKHNYNLKVLPEKLYHLEKNRYMILRKCYSLKEFLFLFPSLILAEFLVFGYATKFGWKGINYKLKSVKDGINIKVNKEKGDRRNLLNSLSIEIPIEQLTFNKIEKLFKIFANKIFILNIKVVL